MIYKLFVSKHSSKITNQQQELSAAEAKRDFCLFGSVENRTQTRQIPVQLDRRNKWNLCASVAKIFISRRWAMITQINEVNGFVAHHRAIFDSCTHPRLFGVSRKCTCLANHEITQISTRKYDNTRYKYKNIINIMYVLHSSCTIFSQKIE